MFRLGGYICPYRWRGWCVQVVMMVVVRVCMFVCVIEGEGGVGCITSLNQGPHYNMIGCSLLYPNIQTKVKGVSSQISR